MAGVTRHVVARFPAYELAVERLFRSSESFREMCDEYNDGIEALERWRRAARPRAELEELKGLLTDLEAEILATLRTLCTNKKERSAPDPIRATLSEAAPFDSAPHAGGNEVFRCEAPPGLPAAARQPSPCRGRWSTASPRSGPSASSDCPFPEALGVELDRILRDDGVRVVRDGIIGTQLDHGAAERGKPDRHYPMLPISWNSGLAPLSADPTLPR